MDDIRQEAKLAYNRALARKNLHERMEARLLLAHNGGLFRCDTQLIALLHCYADESEIVVLDSQGTPFKIVPKSLLIEAKRRHQECMNEWHLAHVEFSRIRSVKDV